MEGGGVIEMMGISARYPFKGPAFRFAGFSRINCQLLQFSILSAKICTFNKHVAFDTEAKSVPQRKVYMWFHDCPQFKKKNRTRLVLAKFGATVNSSTIFGGPKFIIPENLALPSK